MEYLIERKNYYSIGDIVIIEYWYKDILTIVKIIDKIGNRYLVSHNLPKSKIFNAPNEIIKSTDIIDKFKN